MSLNSVERLKKDYNETLHYRKRLLKKGKDIQAYRMQRKADYLSEAIKYLRTAS